MWFAFGLLLISFGVLNLLLSFGGNQQIIKSGKLIDKLSNLNQILVDFW